MSSTRSALVAACPTCDTLIRFAVKPKLGQFVSCPECEDLSEVIQLSPIKLAWAEEDYDDEWEEDDYEDAEDDYDYEDDDDYDYDDDEDDEAYDD